MIILIVLSSVALIQINILLALRIYETRQRMRKSTTPIKSILDVIRG